MSLEEAGLTLDLVVQLCLKTLFFAGELSGTDLAHRLGLVFSVIEPAVEALKSQRHCEITGGAMLGGSAYRYRITDAGRVRAALFLEQNHYVGRAPVPLEQYRHYMERFGQRRRVGVTRDAVRRAFSHLVLPQRVLDQLGPAINAGHSLFVYGPPGNGKTVISQAIRNLLLGEIAIPHALEVEGSIIRVFDPVAHQELPADDHDRLGLENSTDVDERWVRCRRPLVLVGGELTLDQLDVRYSPTLGFYRAPIQTVANGGVLVIDDFGRQACSPRDLLNRWIVPLETYTDFLTLQTGQKIELPFMAMVVFATNIRPADLVDEAFIRRIQYKVFATSPTPAEFMQIFENYSRDKGLEFKPEVIQELIDTYYRPRNIELRGCHARDLIEQSRSLAEYLDRPFELSLDLLREASDSYFVDDQPPAE
jgi:predicted ATPase with chaperone activity